jgi:hypothetical protein
MRTLLRTVLILTALATMSPALPANSAGVHITTEVRTTQSEFSWAAYFAPPVPEIACQLDTAFVANGIKEPAFAYCTTDTTKRMQEITLYTSGKMKSCVKSGCSSNGDPSDPLFKPGTSITSGPFTCVVSWMTVTCRLPDGVGFAITPSSLRRLSRS